MKVIIAGLLMLGCAGTTKSPGETPQDVDRERLSAMEAELQRLIGTATCESDAECRSIAVGAKPCGGPWRYEIYSTRITDSGQFLEQVEAYRALNVELNRKYGWTSDCSVVSEPVVACREGHCSR